MSYQLCLNCGCECDPLRFTCPNCGSYSLLGIKTLDDTTDSEPPNNYDDIYSEMEDSDNE